MNQRTAKSDSSRQRGVEAVIRACKLIESAAEPPRLRDLAAAAGLSESHLHRQFKRLLGVTPKEYADGKRVMRLQEALESGQPVTAAIYAAGYGSGSRVYENPNRVLGMTPGTYRAGGRGMSIDYTVADCALGRLMVAATDVGVCCIEFGDSPAVLRESLAERFPAAVLNEDAQRLSRWVHKIIQFIKNPAKGIEIPIDIQGTAFQRRVWKALQAIPVGQTASYRDVAAAIGKPSAARAVASACGANMVALAIPCHRVVRSDGTLSGYRWGVERKRRLLQREKEAS